MQSHSNNQQAHKGNINHSNVNFFNIYKTEFSVLPGGGANHEYVHTDC